MTSNFCREYTDHTFALVHTFLEHIMPRERGTGSTLALQLSHALYPFRWGMAMICALLTSALLMVDSESL